MLELDASNVMLDGVLLAPPPDKICKGSPRSFSRDVPQRSNSRENMENLTLANRDCITKITGIFVPYITSNISETNIWCIPIGSTLLLTLEEEHVSYTTLFISTGNLRP